MKPTDIWSPLPPTFLGSTLNQFLAGLGKTAKPAGLSVSAKRSFACGLLDDAKQQLTLLQRDRYLEHLRAAIAGVVCGLRQAGLFLICLQCLRYRKGLGDIAGLQQLTTLIDHPSRPVTGLIAKPLIGLPIHD
jgi:hypothetical protein